MRNQLLIHPRNNVILQLRVLICEIERLLDVGIETASTKKNKKKTNNFSKIKLQSPTWSIN